MTPQLQELAVEASSGEPRGATRTRTFVPELGPNAALAAHVHVELVVKKAASSEVVRAAVGQST